MQRDGSFAADGNIFDEDLAEKYKIRKRREGEDQCRYIVSDNGSTVSMAPDVDVCAMPLRLMTAHVPSSNTLDFHRSLESIVEGHLKHKIAFSKGHGALLAMLRPCLNTIAYPRRLSRLLADQRDWSGMVIVSEVYTCRSYARLLVHSSSKEITFGLGATIPIAAAVGVPVSVGGDVDVQWQTDATSGDWKTSHFERIKSRRDPKNGDNAKFGNEDNEDGPLCYPLFKLVALRRPHGAPVSTVRSTLDLELPVAIPPWMESGGEEVVTEDGEDLSGDEDQLDMREQSAPSTQCGRKDRECDGVVSTSWWRWRAVKERFMSCVHCVVRVSIHDVIMDGFADCRQFRVLDSISELSKMYRKYWNKLWASVSC